MIIITLSLVIAQAISYKMVTEVSGTNNKVKTSAKYDILSVDLSRSKDANGQCDCLVPRFGYLLVPRFRAG